MLSETPIIFECAGDELVGILHPPAHVASAGIGVLLVVGGPQYRVGSHRQFVLLARDLAAAGIPVFRFDYRGLGDSAGVRRDFEGIADDITAAEEVFFSHQDGLKSVVLWGLCDAATANAFYGSEDGRNRVIGQIALNPWARTPEGQAEAYIKHYYAKRLLSADFWNKMFSFKVNPRAAIGDFLAKLGQARKKRTTSVQSESRPLPTRLCEAQLAFNRPVLIILSGQDLTAKEYESRVNESAEWRQWFESEMVQVSRLEQADHTFSRAEWRGKVARWSREWVQGLADPRQAPAMGRDAPERGVGSRNNHKHRTARQR